ncbi:MAG: AsmA-like C-terminal region-containing protein [Cytophagales bacterium]
MKFLFIIVKYFGFFLLFFVFIITISGLLLFIKKDDIWLSTKKQISVALKSSLEIESIRLSFPEHFPNLSLSLRNLKITDSLSHSEVLKIGNFKADIDLMSIILLKPKLYSILLQDANFQLVTDNEGLLNVSILNPNKTSIDVVDSITKPISLHFNIPLKKIVLQDVSFTFTNISQNQNIALKALDVEILVSQADNESKFSVDGLVYFRGLGFDTKLGYFLEDKTVDAHIIAKIPANDEKIVFMPSFVNIDGERYNVNGFLKPALYPDIELVIGTDQAVVPKVLTCLTQNVADQIKPYKVENTVHAVITISGPLYPDQDPKIDLRFWSENNKFTYKDLPFKVEKMRFEGIVCNHIDTNKVPGDPNTSFEIRNVKGKIGYGDLISNVKIVNLIDPKIDVKANLSINLAIIADSIPDLPFQDLKGFARLNIDYSGTIPEGKELSQIHKWKYDGNIDFEKIGFKAGGISYKDIHGKMMLHNDTVVIPKGFGFEIAGNKVVASGYVYKPIEYFLIPNTLLEVYLNVKSSYFNINNLMMKSEKKVSKAKSERSFKEVTKALQNMRFVIALDFKEAMFRKLKVENLHGEFNRKGGEMQLKNITLKTSGGSMAIDMKAGNLDTDLQNGTAVVKINNMDVKKLFYGMNNFDQNTVESRHLEGRFNANVTFATKFTEGYQILPSTMRGNLDFQLKNGHLKDFEPIQNVSKFIFKNRDFTDIRFERLSQKATLKGKTLQIADMKIQSNILTLFVNGSYSFDNKVDLKIRIPWVNFRSKASYLAAIEKDQTDAKALHIKAFTKNGKLNFGLGK